MRHDRRRRWAVLVGATAAMVAGPLLPGTASAVAAYGTIVTEPSYGFSFTLPANWKQVPLNGTDVKALLNAAAHNDPTLANALNEEVSSATAKGVKVFAIGPLNGLAVPNVNILVTSAAGAPTGRAFAQGAVAEAKIGLTEIGAVHTRTSIVHNQLGTAALATYQLNLKGSASQYGVQFYALHTSRIDIISVTTSSPSQSRADARVIVNSWRWR